ncbi:hypothetical protein RQP46_000600 [Phenoliferia psychrophenolica]
MAANEGGLQVISGYGVLSYSSQGKTFTTPPASTPYIGYGAELLLNSTKIFNESYHPPYPAYAPPGNATADLTIKLHLNRTVINPAFRDGFNTRSGGFTNATWTAVRFVSNDAGPTFIHCHISLHFSAGMSVLLLESMANIENIPQQYINYANSASGLNFTKPLLIKEP